jgi:predicted Rossmann fold flavoprotein
VTYHTVVIGAGAAGMMCAAHAARHGARVLLVEHGAVAGRKIRISGGGRCNFTNIHTTHHAMVGRNPDFTRSALAGYTAQDFLDLVNAYGIAWHEKTLGQLFCNGSAQQIIDMLLSECRQAGVELRFSCAVSAVTHAHHFAIHTSQGLVHAQNVVVATGGLSIPTLGATDVGYRIAKHFGLDVVDRAPGLVPLVFDPLFQSQWASCAGLSLPVVASTSWASFPEAMLFTHRGLSGPAILQISTYLTKDSVHEQGALQPFRVDALPGMDVDTVFGIPNREPRLVKNVVAERLPRRFVEQWPFADGNSRVDQTPKAALAATIAALRDWHLQPKSTEGYAKAEVTRGGVDVRHLSQKTMECTTVPGLYFIGEVVDVTGWLGGYNFQWAWSSGVAAGRALTRAAAASGAPA